MDIITALKIACSASPSKEDLTSAVAYAIDTSSLKSGAEVYKWLLKHADEYGLDQSALVERRMTILVLAKILLDVQKRPKPAIKSNANLGRDR